MPSTPLQPTWKSFHDVPPPDGYYWTRFHDDPPEYYTIVEVHNKHIWFMSNDVPEKLTGNTREYYSKPILPPPL